MGFIQTIPIMRQTQENIILVLNCTLTFVATAFICYFSSVEKKKRLPIKEETKEEEEKEKTMELTPSKDNEKAVEEYTKDLGALLDEKVEAKHAKKEKLKLRKI